VMARAAKRPPPARPMVTASPGTTLSAPRGYWQGAVQNSPDLPAAFTAPSKYETASIGRASTALAYAAEADITAPARARPMGSPLPPLPQEATVMPAGANTTIVEKASLATTAANAGQNIESPWLRAAMLTPDFKSYMTATQLGATDMRPLQELLYKPSQALVMTFSTDPQPGMVTGRFEGPAVVFLATTSFKLQSTASLR